MKRYLVLYHSPMSPREMMANASPEEAKAAMDAWMAWAQRSGDGIVDLGVPLDGGSHIQGDVTSVSDGTVAGYSVVQADSLEAATALLEGHPHLSTPGGEIDILEGLAMPGM